MADDDWRSQLSAHRKRVGLSRRALAEVAGVSPHVIKAYETGLRNAPRDRLEALIAALDIPNAAANEMRESAGFTEVNFLFAGDRGRNFFFTLEELPAEVERTPWPQFVVNDALEVVAANDWVTAVWDIDWASEDASRTRAQRNLLALVSEHRFAERLRNWEEILAIFVSIFKAPAPTSFSIDAPTPYFNEVIEEFLRGEPAFLARLLEIWAVAEPTESKVRSSYPVVWEDPEFGVMRFCGIVTNASYVDALSFNDWIPFDAATWDVLVQVKSRVGRGFGR